MKISKFKPLFVILGAILFDFLFWSNQLGLNILIFTVSIIIMQIIFNPLKKFSKNAIITGIATLISAGFVVINNSYATFFAYFISFIIYMGFYFNTEIKSIITAFFTAIANFFTSQIKFIKSLNDNIKVINLKKIWRYTKLIFIPLIILFIFHKIFQAANPVYEQYAQNISVYINDFLLNLFEDVVWARFFLFLFALFLVIAFLYKGNIFFFLNNEKKYKLNIKRKRLKHITPFKLLSLKTENKIGSILIILVNILLLAVNIIDINWIWFGNVSSDDATLSQMVHEGTYLLILSIFLSMAIMLYFFRRNQNFYPKNKTLKYTAFIWVFQNMVLTISVALRNYHYIYNCGLAYKRIGVIIFLILTIAGLILMYIKIKDKKTVYFLLKYNAWCVFIMMIFVASINWDVLIANYNLNVANKKGIDREFLYSLSDKSLYITVYNNNKIMNDIDKLNWKNFSTSAEKNRKKVIKTIWNKKLTEKIDNFMQDYKNRTWQEWNYADYYCYKKLKKIYYKE